MGWFNHQLKLLFEDWKSYQVQLREVVSTVNMSTATKQRRMVSWDDPRKSFLPLTGRISGKPPAAPSLVNRVKSAPTNGRRYMGNWGCNLYKWSYNSTSRVPPCSTAYIPNNLTTIYFCKHSPSKGGSLLKGFWSRISSTTLVIFGDRWTGRHSWCKFSDYKWGALYPITDPWDDCIFAYI